MRFTHIAVVQGSLAIFLLAGVPLAMADELSSTPAAASPQAASSAGSNASEHPVGSATHNWLSLQSSNASAAPARAGGGEEASLVYHRYLDSFKHAIPAFFASSTGKSSGGSSGGSN